MICPNCDGPMELHERDKCVMDYEPHFYCLTPNCGTVVKIPPYDTAVLEPA